MSGLSDLRGLRIEPKQNIQHTKQEELSLESDIAWALAVL